MNDCDVELLGQKFSYPKTYPAFLAVSIISIAIVALTYIVTVLATPDRIDQLGKVFINGFTDSEGLTTPQESYTLGFWSPSNTTTDYWNTWILNNPNSQVAKNQLWEINSANDQRAFDFGEALTCGGCPSTGYRRYPVLGRGRSSEQPGYWWVATIRADYPVKDFVSMYSEFWGSTDSIYVEVLKNVDVSYEQ